MKKLRYYYGTMNSMKSATLLMKAHQFEQAGCKVLLLKPDSDNRDVGEVKSRAIQYGRECILFGKDVNLIHFMYTKMNKEIQGEDRIVLFFDESNFMTKEQVRQLWELSKYHNMEIFCYGLKTNYKNKLIDSSTELWLWADTSEEIKSMCSKCESKATTHLLIIDGEIVFEGEDEITGDVLNKDKKKTKEGYLSVCQVCYDKEYRKYKGNE